MHRSLETRTSEPWDMGRSWLSLDKFCVTWTGPLAGFCLQILLAWHSPLPGLAHMPTAGSHLRGQDQITPPLDWGVSSSTTPDRQEEQPPLPHPRQNAGWSTPNLAPPPAVNDRRPSSRQCARPFGCQETRWLTRRMRKVLPAPNRPGGPPGHFAAFKASPWRLHTQNGSLAPACPPTLLPDRLPRGNPLWGEHYTDPQ